MSNKIYLGSKCIHASTNEKGKYFVCSSEALVDGKTFSEIGEGSTLENARENAKHNLKAVVDRYDQQSQSGMNIFDSHPERKETPKELRNGGGNHPITEKQIDFIRNMAEIKGEDADKLAEQLYHKPLNGLIGAEAHNIIQKLK